MQLRNQVEWALHCSAVLAGVPAGRFLPAKALAEFHGVPQAYLSKALQALARAGIVEGTLGPAGGYRLAKAPAAISFLDVVEAVEGRASTFACAEIRRNNPCASPAHPPSGPCAIARVMWEADEAWRARLAAVSLADLGATLADELPAELRDGIAAWVAERT